MTVNELITKLEELRKKVGHGNDEVTIEAAFSPCSLSGTEEACLDAADFVQCPDEKRVKIKLD